MAPTGLTTTTVTASTTRRVSPPKLILAPILILTVFAALVGFVNATPFGEDWEQFKKYVEPRPEAVVLGESDASGRRGRHRPAPRRRDGDRPRRRRGGRGHRGHRGRHGEEGEEHSAEGEEAAHASGCGFEAPEAGTACYFPTIDHAEFEWSKAALSLVIVAAGLISSWFVCVALYTRRDRRLVGPHRAERPVRARYLFLANKYYLDALYEGVIVRAIAHPIARAANWFNQHVIDGVVNGAGWSGRKLGGLVYRNIDQRVVDGAVNGSGAVANGTGSALRPVQSGKVNQYGALLFGAAAVGALVLVIVNV